MRLSGPNVNVGPATLGTAVVGEDDESDEEVAFWGRKGSFNLSLFHRFEYIKLGGYPKAFQSYSAFFLLAIWLPKNA